MNEFIEALKKRRSIYMLGRNVKMPQDDIKELVKEVVELSPTAFNSQSQRVVILFDKAHEKVWDFTEAELKKVTPADRFPTTQAKIKGFRDAYGTILFFEDQETVKALQEKFPTYADNFPIWSEQASGLTTSNVWTALATVGIGANIQHYNPLIDEDIANEWKLPASWKLRSQMVFGSTEAEAQPKEFMDRGSRFKTFH